MKFIFAIVLLISTSVIAEDPDSFTKCFETDSIGCVQMAVFRHAKSFFEKPSIEIFGGLSLMKSADSRQAKSLEDNSVAVESAKTVEARNNELESYFITNAKRFFQERSLSFNFANAARSISNAIPDEIKNDIRDLVVEGRSKRRKLMKKLMPIIIGLKVKLVALMFASLFGLLFIAKKALVVSVIALGIAIFAGISGLGSLGGSGGGGGIFSRLGSLFGGGLGSGIGGYSAGGSGVGGGGGGWSSGAGVGYSGGGGGHGGWSSGGGGYDSHGAYSQQVAQSVAYSAQKPSRR